MTKERRRIRDLSRACKTHRWFGKTSHQYSTMQEIRRRIPGFGRKKRGFGRKASARQCWRGYRAGTSV